MKTPHVLAGAAMTIVAAFSMLVPAFALAATNTTIVVSPTTATYGSVTLSATLTTNPGGSDIYNEDVSFYVDNSYVGSSHTNHSGVATLDVSVDAGTHTIKASFSGNGGYDSSTNSTTLTVSQLTLTVTGINAQNKSYDGTDSATLYNLNHAQLHGVINGDHVSLDTTGATGAFTDPNVGTDKEVDVGGMTLTGSDSTNYTLGTPQATTRANITKVSQTFTFSLSGLPAASTTLGAADFSISSYATAQATTSTTFTSTSTACAISNGVVQLISVGTCSISASNPGDENYFGAGPIFQTFQIAAPHIWYVNAAAAANGNGASPATATTTIQAAINAAAAGDTILVYGGNYNETAPNSTLDNADGGGTYQFGLFLPSTKPGLTIEGVDSNWIPITNAADIVANVTTNSNADFGPDGVLVEGANDTIQGLNIGENNPTYGTNKSIEDIANNFTLKDSEISDPNGGDLYIDDFTGAGTTVQSYTVEDNIFANGTTLDIASGAGGDGTSPVSERQITGNTFSGAPADYAYALISFDGSGGQPWYVYPVGGAEITGNTFSSGGDGTMYIRTRGTVVNPSQFDWQSYWNDNTFDNSVVDLTNATNFTVQPYSYATYTNVMDIGTSIQNELANAQAGNTILIGNGNYSGDINITQDNLTLKGASEAGVVVNQNAATPFGDGITVTAASGVTLSNMTFDTPNHAPFTYAFHAYQGSNLTLSDLTFNGPGQTSVYANTTTGIGGVDINSVDGVTISDVNSNNYSKNGFSFTAQNLPADPITQDVTLTDLTSNSNAWDGIAFYTESSGNNGQDINDVTFSGTNSLTNNSQGGIYFEGDTDDNVGIGATPRFTVTGPSDAAINLSTLAFSGNSPYDIINYQTAPVYAIGATFDPGAITGDQMTTAQRTIEDGKILDQLNNPVLGLVTYYNATITVTIDKFIDGKAASTTAATAAFPMVSSWTATNTGSGSGTYTLSPTGFNSPNSYEAITSPMDSGAEYATNEVTGGSVVGADCSGGQPFQLAGYTTGSSLAAAEGATPSLTSPSFTNLTNNAYVIVWNDYCVPTPAITTPTNGLVTTSANLTQVDWTSVTDTPGGITYTYQASNSSAVNADGSFSSPIYTQNGIATTSIASSNTPDGTYYIQVQAKDADGNVSAWSPTIEVIVNSNPSVTTDAATGVTDTNATLNGTDGGINADNTSFWWGTTPISGTLISGTDPAATEFPASGWSHDNGLGTATADASFDESFTNLTPGTTYYFVAWIESNGTWYPGAVESFTTTGTTPNASVTTDAATGIDQTDATLNALNGGLPADNTSFWWGTTSIGALTPGANPGATEFPASGWSHDSGLGGAAANGTFNEPLSGLTPDTQYNFVAWVESNGTWYPGAELSFTTGSGPAVGTPGVTTDAATSPSDADATLNATNGGVAADAESFWVSTSSIDFSDPNAIPTGVYSTPVITDPTELATSSSFSDPLSLVTSAGITANGNENMMPITPSTTYYYVAWSNVNGQWYSGGQQSVTTSNTPPVAPTAVADTATTNINTEVTIDVLANDTGSPTGIDPASITPTTTNGGTVVIDGTEIDYTPANNFSGTDSFTYEAYNGVGTSSPATVSVTVVDTSTPVLTVVGDNPDYIEVNAPYVDQGVTISDAASPNIGYGLSLDGEATTSLSAFNSADLLSTSTPGTHTILYAATNGGGNTGYATRTVVVLDPLSIALTSTSATNTTSSDSPIAVTATFSEPVESFTTGDITVTNGSASNVQLNASSTTATFNVLPASNGAVTVVIPAGDVLNMAGVGTTTSAEIDFTYAAANNNNNNNNNNGNGGGGSGGGNGAPQQTYSPFDLNHDGKVNLLDLNILFSNWGKTGANIPGDFNHDGVVNLEDLNLFLANWLS